MKAGIGLNTLHRELTRATEGTVVRDRVAEREIGFSEVIFSVPTENPNVRILVYTTYDAKTKQFREIGDDAVKFVVEYKGKKRTRYVGKLKKVHRTIGNGNGDRYAFLERLVHRVAIIAALAVPIQRCECGSILVPRWARKKRKWFQGCLDYCGHSRDVDIVEAS